MRQEDDPTRQRGRPTQETPLLPPDTLNTCRSEAMRPHTKYAHSGDVNIAYQVMGDGPLDLVMVPGWVSHLEYAWEEPRPEYFFNRLASFARFIRFDKRGTGLSDRVPDSALPTLEMRMDDVRAVMDAVGSERAALFGISEGGVMAALFAATHPHRTVALVLYGTYARRLWAPDYPWAPTLEQRQKFFDLIQQDWGGVVDISTMAPTLAGDETFRQWWATMLRLGASPGAALTLAKMNSQVDIRHVLPAIRVPTLVIHRRGDRDMRVEEGRYVASQIPEAKFVELPGDDHVPYVGNVDALVDEVQEFLTGVRPVPQPDRVLATVLFVDIADSTLRAVEIGDHRWSQLLEGFYERARRELSRYRGHEVDTAGDGLLATFDGPARGIRSAIAIGEAVRPLGLRVRAGLHTGEVEVLPDRKVRGLAVHIGARVAALAGSGEVLVSSTVKDLVAGAGIEFEARGVQTLRGVPGEWRLFAVTKA